MLLLAVLALAVELRTSGRARPPVAARDAAVAAFETASRGPAARWAPEALRAADVALRDALLAWSRQESRIVPLRDFRPVAGQLSGAAALAREAGRLGDLRRSEGRLAAQAAILEARAIEAHATALVAATTLPRGQRVRLQRARLQLREAETLLGEGEIATARERAEGSQAALREALGPGPRGGGALHLARGDRRLAALDRGDPRLVQEDRPARDPGPQGEERPRPAVEGRPVKTYDAEIGSNALGVKRRQGDRATPEGRYRVVKRKDRGQSRYYRALLLDYPNAADRERFAAAQRRGEIPRGARIGGLIEIHGEGGRGQNWTEGCVALSNRDIDDLFPRVGVGTRVTIVGGDGRDGAFSDLLARVGGGAENAKP